LICRSPTAVLPYRAPISRPNRASAGRCRPSDTGRPAPTSRCPLLCAGAGAGDDDDDCSAGDCGDLPREPRRHLDGDCTRVATNDRAPSLFPCALRFVLSIVRTPISLRYCNVVINRLIVTRVTETDHRQSKSQKQPAVSIIPR